MSSDLKRFILPAGSKYKLLRGKNELYMGISAKRRKKLKKETDVLEWDEKKGTKKKGFFARFPAGKGGQG